MIICTAGHVDHGKTSLVKAITGIDTDRLAEEKKRGLTIEAGYAYCNLDSAITDDSKSVRLGFVDMPGHERFVHNMLASLSGIDFALLVIAADDGPMPQTREHLEILKLLNMQQGAVVITKIDRVDAQRLNQVETSISNILEHSFLSEAPVFNISNTEGSGIRALKQHLLETANQLKEKSSEQYFRLAIDRCFSIKGAGCVVTGSVIAGSVTKEQPLVISPSGYEARVRSLRVQDQDTDIAHTGDRCALNIAGSDISVAQIQRGDWIIDAKLHQPTSRIDVLVTMLVDQGNNRPVHLHHGSQRLQARLTDLDGKPFKAGTTKIAQLVLHQAIHALSNDYFILRDDAASTTIGGGNIIDPFAPVKGRRTPKRLDILNALMKADPKQRCQALLNLSDFGLNISQLALSDNLAQSVVKNQIENAKYFTQHQHGQVQDYAIRAEYFEKMAAKLAAILQKHHQSAPDSPGLDKQQLSKALATDSGQPSFELIASVAAELIEKQLIGLSANHYCVVNHRFELDVATQRIWNLIEVPIREGGTRPPIVHELLELCKLDLKSLKKALKILCAKQYLIQVADNRFYLPETVTELAKLVEQTAGKNETGAVTVSDFRNDTGLGRNLSIQVLEYFDRQKFTRRDDNHRYLLKKSEQLFS